MKQPNNEISVWAIETRNSGSISAVAICKWGWVMLVPNL